MNLIWITLFCLVFQVSFTLGNPPKGRASSPTEQQKREFFYTISLVTIMVVLIVLWLCKKCCDSKDTWSSMHSPSPTTILNPPQISAISYDPDVGRSPNRGPITNCTELNNNYFNNSYSFRLAKNHRCKRHEDIEMKDISPPLPLNIKEINTFGNLGRGQITPPQKLKLKESAIPLENIEMETVVTKL